MVPRIRVQQAPFDTGKELTQLGRASGQVGAIASFIGLVRDINEDDQVAGLYLEHYPGMTEKQIAGIVEEASARWQILSATVIHRVGNLQPSDEIVFVGTASEHRHDAFQASEFIMDFLKTRATFWKKERTPDGERWLTTRQQDVDAVKTWE
ncbi:MAG: molybdopterin synthase catalytic subunit MoaE, partial [Pseudomonadales bacterium]